MPNNAAQSGPSGIAKRLSIAGVVLAILAGAFIYLYATSGPAPKAATGAEYLLSPVTDNLPSHLRFTDVTAGTGIDYRHETGGFIADNGEPSRHMPETMGPGVTLFDFDGDGDLDIFIANSVPLSPHAADQRPAIGLFRNEGAFRFTDAAPGSGLNIPLYGMGAAAADYDGDRDQDLLITGWGGVRLLRNNGTGIFENVTEPAGLSMHTGADHSGELAPDWSTGAAFFDADADGDLDLLVVNYVRWLPQNDIYSTRDGRHKSFSTPVLYKGSTPRLYLQENGRFLETTRQSGILNPEAKTLGVALWDFGDDGLLDIVIANDTQPNYLYRNLGGGQFQEQGLAAGVAYDQNGKTRAGMGIDIADYMNDRKATIAIGNFSHEPVSLFRQLAPGFFHESSQSTGLASVTYLTLTFGLLFADVDLDGRQDLLLANGHIEPHIGNIESGVSYRQPLQLLGNLGDGRFAEWTNAAGPAFTEPMVGRGLAVGDLDGDGDLDIVVSSNGGGLRVIRNDSTAPAGDRHYIRVSLRGRTPNTDAIGARIMVKSGDLIQTRIVRTGSSYLSQSELTQTFGLGERDHIDAIEVRWPGGLTRNIENVEADQTMVVDE